MNEFVNFKLSVRGALFFMAIVFCLAGTADASGSDLLQGDSWPLKGQVCDEHGAPLVGATVAFDNKSGGVLVDDSGRFEVAVSPGDKLTVSLLGYTPQAITVESQREIIVVLKSKDTVMDEVTVVAFATQKKQSVIGSVTTVKPADLQVPSSDFTTSLAGRIAGVIAYSQSGEPGKDNTQFFIRGVTSFGTGKKDPLILVDNIEMTATDLARIQPDDIASFSIMKDATATALYGARGANGVILIKTKEGREGKAKVSLRIENSFSMPVMKIPLADPVTFMKLHNEAVYSANPLSVLPYTDTKIINTRSGIDPLRYPAVNWYNEMFRNYSLNQRANFNVNGGGEVAQYYIAASFSHDSGLLKVPKLNNFNNNINLNTYVLRSNITINLTKTTKAVIRLHGSFDDYRGPIDSGDEVYKKVISGNPVLFHPTYPADEANLNTKHVLFGNYDAGNYVNPYAEMVKGYRDYSRALMLAQFEVSQNFDFITEGLAMRGLVNIDRYSYFDASRSYKPFFYNIDQTEDDYTLVQLNEGAAEEQLSYNPIANEVRAVFYSEVAATYNRTFAEKHGISAMLVMIARQQLNSRRAAGETETLIQSLPYRNLGLSGRLTYSFGDRYFAEFNFGYNGSERFAKKERYGFFPSAGIGYMISNEKFWEPLKKVIPMFKLKATYGLVGNDAIGRAEDRFFYMSRVNMQDGGQTYRFGTEMQTMVNGISIQQYDNPLVTWEISRKMNLGIEMSLFDRLEIQADYFTERRENILMQRVVIPTTMGLQTDNIFANVGEAKSRGFEISADYMHSFGGDAWITGRGNFTFAQSEYTKYEEVDYAALGVPWVSNVGLHINQHKGYIAERLFIDEAEIYNSPSQTGIGGEIKPGDIKYVDINDDGKIDDLDRVNIGYPITPEIVYGFGISAGWKGLDFSCFFQGSARVSFMIDTGSISPFVNKYSGYGLLSNTAVLKEIADNHWSEDNHDQYAFWPRLTPTASQNNSHVSTWWMRNGSFLRLKSVELGFTLPSKWTKKIAIELLRIYVSGTNLFTVSKFKMWDPEMGAYGLNYPLQKVYNIGLNINF